jgi:hypothetical protein
MGRGDSWRNKLVEEGLLGRIDRQREHGGDAPKNTGLEEYKKKRLHECKTGDWVREIMPGTGNFGPQMRILDPKTGIVESRAGRVQRVPPRTMVAVQV